MANLKKSTAKKNCNLKKSTAEKNLSELLEIIEKINLTHDKYIYPYKVKNLYVFGSYLSEKINIGDIDLLIDLYPLWDNNQDMVEQFKDVRAYKGGISGLFRLWENPKFLIFKTLRNKKSCYSFHNMDEYEELSKFKDFKYNVLVENFEIKK